MGIPDANGVYEDTYGHSGRVILDDDTQPTSKAPMYSLDMVDYPTYSMSLLAVLSRDMASRILTFQSKNVANLGQMIVFYRRSSGHILRTVYDEYNALQDDDMNVLNVQHGNAVDAAMLRASMTSCSSAVREFYNTVKAYDGALVAVKRVSVNIPQSLDSVNEIVKHVTEGNHVMSTPSGYRVEDVESMSQWLQKHEHLKPRHFINNHHIFSSMGNCYTRYHSAFLAGELEGIMLLYAHRLIQSFKKTLKKSSGQLGSYLIMFIDCMPPAIKEMARLKRRTTNEKK